MTTRDLLISLGACGKATRWVGDRTAYAACAYQPPFSGLPDAPERIGQLIGLAQLVCEAFGLERPTLDETRQLAAEVRTR